MCKSLYFLIFSERSGITDTNPHLFLFFKLLFYYYFVSVGGALHTWTSVYQVCAWCSHRPEEGIRSPGTGVKGGCKLPCECWELNLGPLKEQLTFKPVSHLSSPLFNLRDLPTRLPHCFLVGALFDWDCCST